MDISNYYNYLALKLLSLIYDVINHIIYTTWKDNI
jgi:hypothetical protein